MGEGSRGSGGLSLGKRYWRSLEELAASPAFRERIQQEFPELAEELVAPATRRSILKVMAASLALAGLTACRWPKERIMPFAYRPEGYVPGVPQHFATALELGGAALGVLVKSYDGRPIKVEGNPAHPSSLGAATAWAQAAVLEMYDPERSTTLVRREGGQRRVPTWDDFLALATEHAASLQASGGAGFAVLAEATSSPTVLALKNRLEEQFPRGLWVEYEPVSRDFERTGLAQAFGGPVRPRLHLERAQVIVGLESDLLFGHPEGLRHARHWGAARRAEGGTMPRMYAAEALLTVTGAAADHRLALPAGHMGALLRQLAHELARAGLALPAGWGAEAFAPGSPEARFAALAAGDLLQARPHGLVVVGPAQPPEVHALAAGLNEALGAVGTTVSYLPDPEPGRRSHLDGIARLAAALAEGTVQALWILGGNPAWDAPAELDFARLLAACPQTVHLSLYDNETSQLCRWHLPRAHPLESWGDARAWDGTVSVVQPLIEPLYGGRTLAEVLAALLGEAALSAHDLTRRTFAQQWGGGDEGWRRALSDGVVANSAWAPLRPRLNPEAVEAAARGLELPPAGGQELVLHPDACLHDGRFANNGWLQELPDPITTLTWDNAATLSPEDAQNHKVRHGDVVRLSAGGRSVEAPVLVVPGQARGVVGLALGFGRQAGGRVAAGAGINAYPLRTAAAPWAVRGVHVERTGRRRLLATAQDHHVIDTLGMAERGRRVGSLIREASLAAYRANPEFARNTAWAKARPLWKEIEFKGEHQWGMAIDLSACIGCGACTIACQAENNIPVVGRKQVANGREMHWIRVDRYFAGDPADPEVRFQPMPCQHCENAPCESVCPVAATVHSEEGLNQMVYNRCVGTRYCSNNCPYKVRRFNFFNNFKGVSPTTRMAFNPEVTVRGRGVMEKCTFCIQRIETARIAAKNERRPLRDGDIVPACAQTCPTRAIVFGDLKDPDSEVSRLHRHPRAYGILEELFTRPRTLYLAKLTNPAAPAGEGEASS
ncbi:MAG: TAT-variant-translocated molybdopterin oxidoreductase [Acidobacteriota bacterium]